MFRNRVLSWVIVCCLLLSLPALAETAGDGSDGSTSKSAPSAPVYVPPLPDVLPPYVTAAPRNNVGAPTSDLVPFQATALQNSVRLRATASTHGSLLSELAYGESVRVTGQTTGADSLVWYKVLYGTRTGYIRADQLDPVCGTAEFGGSTEPSGFCQGETNTTAVNVRLSMNTRSYRVRQIRQGQTFTILALAYDGNLQPWYYVCLPTGAIGYILGDYVTVTIGTPAETLPVAAAVETPNLYAASSGSYSVSTTDDWADDLSDGWMDSLTAAPVLETVAPEAAAAVSAPASDGMEELIYLRWINAHMADYASLGTGYQGYTLFDLDGDGIREILVDCGGEGAFVWQVYSCEGDEIIDLGTLSANGYYLAGEGSGMLLISVLSDTETSYARMEKVGYSIVSMYTLVRTADVAWKYTWTYNQKPITTDSLLTLLADFTDDVLQNMGLYQNRVQPRSSIVPAQVIPAVTPEPTIFPVSTPAPTAVPTSAPAPAVYDWTQPPPDATDLNG